MAEEEEEAEAAAAEEEAAARLHRRRPRPNRKAEASRPEIKTRSETGWKPDETRYQSFINIFFSREGIDKK